MTVHFLGTGSALTSAERTTTMLAFEAPNGPPAGGSGDEAASAVFLVDCGGDAVQRILASGLAPADIDAVVLTHEHPDHIGGFPLLVEKLWLHGRRAPVPVYGLATTLAVARCLFEAFDTSQWKDLPALEWHAVADEPGAAVFERGPFRVTASPVDHPVPTIGLRVEAGGAVVAYSCDTAPCGTVATLARGADLLVHEATGHLAGVHSSASDAARCAAAAGVRRLVLVHLPPCVSGEALAEAQALFPATTLADDGDGVEVAARL